jgi:hypothetical protein
MKLRRSIACLCLASCATASAYGKDNAANYKIGIYVSAVALSDGTTTNTISCGFPATFGSTVCSGGVYANGVVSYRLHVDTGTWLLETERQAQDSMFRRTFNEEPSHFKKEKPNPLDLLKNGDKVLFRVETHRKLNGVENDILIPFADDPSREARFVGAFIPAVATPRASTPTDNVRAMCDAHKLSPELEKQYCAAKP